MLSLPSSTRTAVMFMAVVLPATAEAASTPTRIADPDSAGTSVCAQAVPVRIADLNGAGWDFRRAAEVAGRAPLESATIRRIADLRETSVCSGGLGSGFRSPGGSPAASRPEGAFQIGLLPIRLQSEYNTGYPDDLNNGARWAGRGLASSLRLGTQIEWGPLTAALEPEFVYHQNRELELLPVNLGPLPREENAPSRFRYPWHTDIDWPARHGEDAFTKVDLGQSHARLALGGVVLGLSHESLWRGPAARYPTVLSNTAGGFPHLYFGTASPADVGVGELEARVLWGRLDESDYFDQDSQNDTRLFSNGTLTFRPDFAPGLFLGVTSSYQNTIPADGLAFGEYVEFLNFPLLGRDEESTDGNVLGSIFARWVVPESGFEVYAEWAREDFPGSLRDLLREPDHAQGYTLGLQKVWAGEHKWVRLTGELVHLQSPVSDHGLERSTEYTFYRHGTVEQGYTHDGQLLGAFVGPGSHAQYIALDVFTRWGRIGGFVERIRRDDDAYYLGDLSPDIARFGFEHLSNRFSRNGHDVELKVGVGSRVSLLDASRHRSAVELDASIVFGTRANRNFIGWDPRKTLSELASNIPRDFNWSFDLGLVWWPGGAGMQ